MPTILIALTIVLLLFRESATAALNRWTGAPSSNDTGRAATLRALGLLVIVVLIFALAPEVRAVLVLVDMIGVDIFLMLLFFQGRVQLQWVIVAICAPALRSLDSRGWFPMPRPARALFKQHPLWSLYAAAQPVALALLIVMPVAVLVRVLGNALM